MLREPDNWGDTKPAGTGGGNRLAPGGYVLGIVGVEQTKSGKGNTQLLLQLDIAEGNDKNHFRDLGEKLNKECYITHRQGVEGKSLPYFKGFITSVEESNQGYKWNWDEHGLARKKVGACLREEEYINNSGDVRTTLRVAYFCGADRVRKGEVKQLQTKKLDGSPAQPPTAPQPDNDLPF